MKNFRKILAHLWADVQACLYILQCTVLYQTTVHCPLLYYTTLRCTVHYALYFVLGITLHCNTLNCTILYCKLGVFKVKVKVFKVMNRPY